MTRRAEIAGAGFAGLAAAAALARHGWSVRVHERADASRSFGSGIYVFAFAQAVLRQIGAFAAFEAASFEPTCRTIYVDGEARSTTRARPACSAPRPGPCCTVRCWTRRWRRGWKSR